MDAILKQVEQIENILATSACQTLDSQTLGSIKQHLSSIKKCCDPSALTENSQNAAKDDVKSNVDEITTIISKPFIGTKFESDYNGIQTQFWKEFREKNAEKIAAKSFLDSHAQSSNLINQWQDYASIRIKFELLNLKEAIPLFYKEYLQFDRNNIGTLINNAPKDESKGKVSDKVHNNNIHLGLNARSTEQYTNTIQFYVIYRGARALMENYKSSTSLKDHLIGAIGKTQLFANIRDESSLIETLFDNDDKTWSTLLNECKDSGIGDSTIAQNYIATKMCLFIFNESILNDVSIHLKAFCRFIRDLSIYAIVYESPAYQLKNPKVFTKFRKMVTKSTVYCKYYNEDTIVHLICREAGNAMLFNVITQAALPHDKGRTTCGDRVNFFWNVKNGKGETCHSIITGCETRKQVSFHQTNIISYMRERRNEYQAWLKQEKLKQNKNKKILALPGKIESNCSQFIKQQMLSKYFLLFLGCKFTYDDTIIVDNSKNNSNEYADFTKLCESGLLENKEALSVMKTFVLTMIKLIENKIVISDDWLILSFVFCDNFNLDLKSKLTYALQDCGRQCLDSNVVSMTKLRNYQWFRQYLLSSNVWLMRNDAAAIPIQRSTSNNNNIDDSSASNGMVKTISVGSTTSMEEMKSQETGLLFDAIGNIVDNALLKTQTLVFEGVKNEKEKFDSYWMQLVNFDIEKSKTIRIALNTIRQDDKSIGIVTEYTKDELTEMIDDDNENKTDGRGTGAKYNILEEYNIKNYLTRCLGTAHALNGIFQRDMKDLFDEIGNECIGKDGSKLLFQSAPVKIEERCIIKANTDYANEEFPSVASILDFIRCSITFDNSKDFYNCMLKFIEKVNVKRKGKCVTRIVRVKNGFSEANEWKDDISKYRYFDIKFNVVIMHGKLKMIGEIQFLLKSLLKAKKIGHKLYGVSRKQDYFTAVADMAHKDENWKLYEKKIWHCIEENSFEQLSEEIILKPSIILAMSMNNENYSKLLANKTSKYLELHLSAMSHFDKCLISHNDNAISSMPGAYLDFYQKSMKHLPAKHQAVVNKLKANKG